MKNAEQANRIAARLRKLMRAVDQRRSRKWCLKLWRDFVLERDGRKCIACDSKGPLFAHHIFRKVIFPQAQYLTGNGVSLCRACHNLIHRAWNGRPGPGEPFNERSGDDQDYAVELFFAMEIDAKERGVFLDEFYYLSDEVILGLAKLQDLDMFRFKQRQTLTPRIVEVRLIWEQMPQSAGKVIGEVLLQCLADPQTDFHDELRNRLELVN